MELDVGDRDDLAEVDRADLRGQHDREARDVAVPAVGEVDLARLRVGRAGHTDLRRHRADCVFAAQLSASASTIAQRAKPVSLAVRPSGMLSLSFDSSWSPAGTITVVFRLPLPPAVFGVRSRATFGPNWPAGGQLAFSVSEPLAVATEPACGVSVPWPAKVPQVRGRLMTGAAPPRSVIAKLVNATGGRLSNVAVVTPVPASTAIVPTAFTRALLPYVVLVASRKTRAIEPFGAESER